VHSRPCLNLRLLSSSSQHENHSCVSPRNPSQRF
jgi:hypothetical protein